MKVMYDIVCQDCKIIQEDVRLENDGKPLTIVCPECGKIMTKKPNFGSFELKYDNRTDICDWQGNTSQYWTQMKEAKGRGENVRPVSEK